MEMTYTQFIQQWQATENQSLPYVVCRLPHQKRIHLIGQNTRQLHPMDCTSKGFIMSSFTGEKSFSILAQNHYQCNDFPTEQALNPAPTLPQGTDKERYLKLIEQALQQIAQSPLNKVVLSRPIDMPIFPQAPWAIFSQMIHLYPSAFCYFLYHPEIQAHWIGATPERLVSIQQQDFLTMSLAGTRLASHTERPLAEPSPECFPPFPPTGNAQSHKPNPLAQGWGEKELQEQRIVTESILQSLEHKAKNLSTSPVQTVQAGLLQHLCTQIRGTLLPNVSPLQLIQALHPTPAVCGYPTLLARAFILQYEGYDREFYTGFCGLSNFFNNQQFDIFVNLRCAKLGQNTARLYVGGGVLQGSDPQQEWQETQNKASTIARILQPAQS